MTKWQKWQLGFLKDLLSGFQKIESTVSVIVQGPLNQRMEKSLPHYLPLVKKHKHKDKGNLVISCWDSDDLKIIDKFTGDCDVCVVNNKYSSLPSHQQSHSKRGPNPWLYQNHTTSKGLEAATGHISIKVRSDEIFPALHLFHNKMLNTENSLKFLTSDIYFRHDSHEKFHPSDHVIAGLTTRMRRGFNLARIISGSNRVSEFKFPEQLICRALLESSGVEVKDYKSRKIMQQYFDIIPIQSMPGSIWTASYRKYRPMTIREDGWVGDISQL